VVGGARGWGGVGGWRVEVVLAPNQFGQPCWPRWYAGSSCFDRLLLDAKHDYTSCAFIRYCSCSFVTIAMSQLAAIER